MKWEVQCLAHDDHIWLKLGGTVICLYRLWVPAWRGTGEHDSFIWDWNRRGSGSVQFPPGLIRARFCLSYLMTVWILGLSASRSMTLGTSSRKISSKCGITKNMYFFNTFSSEVRPEEGASMRKGDCRRVIAWDQCQSRKDKIGEQPKIDGHTVDHLVAWRFMSK